MAHRVILLIVAHLLLAGCTVPADHPAGDDAPVADEKGPHSEFEGSLLGDKGAAPREGQGPSDRGGGNKPLATTGGSEQNVPREAPEPLGVRISQEAGSIVAHDDVGNVLAAGIQGAEETEVVRTALQKINERGRGSMHFAEGTYTFTTAQLDWGNAYLSALYRRGWENAFFVNSSLEITGTAATVLRFAPGISLELDPQHVEGEQPRGGLILFYYDAPGGSIDLHHIFFNGTAREVNASHQVLLYTLNYASVKFHNNTIVEAQRALWGDFFRNITKGTALVENNYWNMTGFGGVALTLHNALHNGIVQRNRIVGAGFGIFIDTVTNVTVANNTLLDIRRYGIQVWDRASNNRIVDNSIQGGTNRSSIGIDLWIDLGVNYNPLNLSHVPTKGPSNHNMIERNEISTFHTGIRVFGQGNAIVGNRLHSVVVPIDDRGEDTAMSDNTF